MRIENDKIGRVDFHNIPFFVGNTSNIYLSLDNKYSLKVPFSEPRFTLNKNFVKHYRGGGSEWMFHIRNSIYESGEKLWSDINIENYSSIYLTELEKRYQIVENDFRIKSYGVTNIVNSNGKGIVLEYHDAFNMSEISYHENKRIWYSIVPGLLLGLSRFPHGDLKPDNILVDKTFKYLHIIDPGIEITLERRFSDVFNKIILSTPYYYPLLPPSCLNNRTLDVFSMKTEDVFANELCFNNYPDTADLIALGIIFYVAATGQYPFKASLKRTPLWHFNANLYGSPIMRSSSDVNFHNSEINTISSEVDTIFKIEFNGLFHKIYTEIKQPSNINPSISHDENTFIMNLLFGNQPLEFYIDLSKKIFNNIA
jgi:serine/threonine protein kinase